jgi:hypothetical protein
MKLTDILPAIEPQIRYTRLADAIFQLTIEGLITDREKVRIKERLLKRVHREKLELVKI